MKESGDLSKNDMWGEIALSAVYYGRLSMLKWIITNCSPNLRRKNSMDQMVLHYISNWHNDNPELAGALISIHHANFDLDLDLDLEWARRCLD